MALALRTLKSDHFAFGVCSLKQDVISCSNFLTNFSFNISVYSYKSTKPYFVNVPGFKVITICLGGTYFLCCVYIVKIEVANPLICIMFSMVYSWPSFSISPVNQVIRRVAFIAINYFST